MAVSKLSSIAQRWPSTDTNLSMGVASVHQRGEEGQIAIGDVAADQETPRPLSGEGAVVLAGIEIGQFEIGPVMQTRTFGSFSADKRRHALLGSLRTIFTALRDELLRAPG